MSPSGSPRAPSPGSCAAQSSHNGGPVTINPEIPRAQRLALTPPLPLSHFVGLTDRNLAITQAFDLHYASVSRIVRKQESLQREATAKLAKEIWTVEKIGNSICDLGPT